MVFVASKDRLRLVQGSPRGDLRLQVVGSARDGQVVELTAAKCAIGSAAGCTLRLRARGVRPVHCLILRGAKGTVVRAWAPNTQLNGQPFRDALLEVGDRLSIGPVEFEVLPAAEDRPADPTDAGRTVVLDRRPANRPIPRQLGEAPRRRARRRAQVRALIAEVRRLRTELSSIPPQVQDGVSAEDLQARLDAYRLQSENWEATLQTVQGELSTRERQAEERIADLESERRAFAAERTIWQSDLEAIRSELASHEAAAASAEAALQAAQSELTQDRQNRENEHCRLRHQVAEFEVQLAAARQREDESANALLVSELHVRQLNERAAEFEILRQSVDQAQTERARADRELQEARETFNSQLTEAWRELEEQRSAVAGLESAYREKLAEIQSTQEKLEFRERGLAERTQELAKGEAELAVERQRLVEKRAALDDEQIAARESLQRREAQLNEREHGLVEQSNAIQSGADRSAEIAQATQALAVRQLELDQQFEAFARQRQEWEADRTKRTEHFERAQQEFDSQRQQFERARAQQEQELESRLHALDTREKQLIAAQNQHQESVVNSARETQEKLDRQQAELDEAIANLAKERDAFESLGSKSSDRLDEEARQLEREREQLIADRAAWEAERPSESDREEVAADQSEEVVSDQWESDDEEEASASDAGVTYFAAPAASTDTARSELGLADTVRQPPASEDEESIEAYMAALLHRMRGGPGGQVPAPAPEVRRNKRKSDRVQSPPPPETSVESPVDLPVAEDQPKVPVLDLPPAPQELERRRPVELPMHLNVLREIGITHARSAIETHGQQRSLRQAYGTLATSIFCFLAAALVLNFSKSAVTHLAGITILVVGIFWMSTSVWAVKKVISSMHKKRSGLRAMMEEIEAEIALMEQERAAAAEEE